MDRKKELLIRAYLVLFCFVVVAVVILYKVFQISVIEGDKWKSKGADYVQVRTIEADRGSIYADDLSLLVTTLPFFDIYMDTKVPSEKLVNDKIDSLAIGLAKLNPAKSRYEWKSYILSARKQGKQYLSIAKELTVDKKEAYLSLPIFSSGRYGGGIIIERKSKREKPFGQFASRTLGVDRSTADKIGLEDYFDKFLKGPEQKRLMKKLDQDTWIPVMDLDEGNVEKGNDLYTTLNIGLQDITHHALLETCIESEAAEGTAIVMEVETGAIKAMSNFSRDGAGHYSEKYNHAIGKSSEPGSTFKLASVLALLDDGLADMDTKVNLGGGIKKFYNLTMYDSHMHGIQSSTLREAFEISSNVGIATLCQNNYGATQRAGDFVKKLCQFGLCDKTGIEVNGEGIPFVKDPVRNKNEWYGTTIPWMSHGYELHQTPLQMLAFFNAIANDGKKMKPYLVSEIRGKYGTIKKFEPKVEIESIASEKSIRAVQDLLRGVVLRGTAKNLRSDIVTMAGKTGTTVVGYGNQAEKKSYNASFAGYFPAENPKYSVIVVIYKPKGAYYGSSVAAPVFKKIAENYTLIDLELQATMQKPEDILVKRIPKRGVGYKEDFQTIMEYVNMDFKDRSKSNWVEVDPYETKMLIDNKKIKISEVPDVRGMGARDATYVLENIGMDVVMEGVGKVYKQSLLPGSKNNGQPIKIYLD